MNENPVPDQKIVNPIQPNVVNKNYVSPYSIYYSSSYNKQQYPENYQYNPPLNVSQPVPTQVTQPNLPIATQIINPNQNIPPTSLLPPYQNSQLNPQVNYNPNPYQKVQYNGVYGTYNNPNENQNILNSLNTTIGKERIKLMNKFSRLCHENPNLLDSGEKYRYKISQFFESCFNIGYFVYFIFKFNTVYLQSLSKTEKIKKSFKFLAILFLINTPFKIYQDLVISRQYKRNFNDMDNEQVAKILNDLNKQAIRII